MVTVFERLQNSRTLVRLRRLSVLHPRFVGSIPVLCAYLLLILWAVTVSQFHALTGGQ